MTTTPDGVRTVAGLLEGKDVAMLTTRAPDGTLTSRPMALQQVDFDGDLWFVTERTAPLVAHVAADPHVNVTFGDRTTWVSLTGTARVVEDRARLEELWNPVLDAWFGDGPGSPAIVLLHVDAASAEYWTTGKGGLLATAVDLVRANVTGERFSGGESERVEM